MHAIGTKYAQKMLVFMGVPFPVITCMATGFGPLKLPTCGLLATHYIPDPINTSSIFCSVEFCSEFRDQFMISLQ